MTGAEPSGVQRPKAVIAATAVMGLFSIFELIVVAAVFAGVLLSSNVASTDGDAQVPPVGGAMALLIRYQVELTGLQGLIGVAALACGTGVWVGRDWARRGGQITMSVLTALFFINGVVIAVSLGGPHGGGAPIAAVVMFFRVAALGVGAVWAALAAVPVWLLNRGDVRSWCRRRRLTRG